MKYPEHYFPYAFHDDQRFALPEYCQTINHGKALVNHAIVNGRSCILVHRETGKIIDGYRGGQALCV